jgi:hypothetical protein
MAVVESEYAFRGIAAFQAAFGIVAISPNPLGWAEE